MPPVILLKFKQWLGGGGGLHDTTFAVLWYFPLFLPLILHAAACAPLFLLCVPPFFLSLQSVRVPAMGLLYTLPSYSFLMLELFCLFYM